MLQQEVPKDYVIATGKQYSVREFIKWTANALGIVSIQGKGLEEIGYVSNIKGELAPGAAVGQEIVKIDARYFRPAEVETFCDPTRAKVELGWSLK